jgi:peptide/nickel transport system substrate-binding protein
MRCFCANLVGLELLGLTSALPAVELIEPPALVERVASGELPPVQERVPTEPSIVRYDGSGSKPGRYGGDLRLLMGKAKDTRLMVVYGYARLVGYDLNYELVPDLLSSVEVEQDQVFTLKLRNGHKWSDGHPFTSEAFRYYWEDIVGNESLSSFGPPRSLLVEGELPMFEVLDDLTVRYTWSKPNPFFLPALGGARPETIYAAGHYLKQFYERYADAIALSDLAEAESRRDWTAMHTSRFRTYKNTNPKLPSLQPWINTTKAPSQRFKFVRNSFYHRIDTKGHQLPYIDRVLMSIVDGKLIPVKAGAGEADLQARSLNFSDYTFLKESEQRTGSKVDLWATTKGSHVALFPNLSVEDPTWRALIRDVRFRRALSLAIDRSEINQVIYFGLAVEGNETVFESSPLFTRDYQTRWAGFDLDESNRLLDELGLDKRDDNRVRLLADGRLLEIIVETAGEDTQQVSWQHVVSSGYQVVL